MKRFSDILFAIVLGFILLVPLGLIALLIRLSSKGPVIHWSARTGIDNRPFKMPKFRTMKVGAPQVATHLLQNVEDHTFFIGKILRRTSLDELPQLYSILKGDMSFVGPRPALDNQLDLISLRTKHGIQKLVPGVTGWAQINGRDNLTIPEKVQFDLEYMNRASFWFDIDILLLTIKKVIKREGISH